MNSNPENLIPTIKEINKLKDKLEKESIKNISSNWNDLVYAINQLVIKSGLHKAPFIWPMKGRITAPFGERRIRKNGTPYYHSGIDIADNPANKTPIIAAASGTVTRASYFNGYGKCIDIKHPDNLLTRYAHCSELLVKTGDKVKQGQQIAIVGSTGHSTGPHLHFEIRINRKAVNPLEYLPPA